MIEILTDWAGWIVGVFLAAWIANEARKFWWIRELVIKHRSPDEHGFGTGLTNQLSSKQVVALESFATANQLQLAELIRVGKTQAHYMRWLAKNLTGEEPEPPLDT